MFRIRLPNAPKRIISLFPGVPLNFKRKRGERVLTSNSDNLSAPARSLFDQLQFSLSANVFQLNWHNHPVLMDRNSNLLIILNPLAIDECVSAAAAGLSAATILNSNYKISSHPYGIEDEMNLIHHSATELGHKLQCRRLIPLIAGILEFQANHCMKWLGNSNNYPTQSVTVVIVLKDVSSVDGLMNWLFEVGRVDENSCAATKLKMNELLAAEKRSQYYVGKSKFHVFFSPALESNENSPIPILAAHEKGFPVESDESDNRLEIQQFLELCHRQRGTYAINDSAAVASADRNIPVFGVIFGSGISLWPRQPNSSCHRNFELFRQFAEQFQSRQRAGGDEKQSDATVTAAAISNSSASVAVNADANANGANSVSVSVSESVPVPVTDSEPSNKSMVNFGFFDAQRAQRQRQRQRQRQHGNESIVIGDVYDIGIYRMSIVEQNKFQLIQKFPIEANELMKKEKLSKWMNQVIKNECESLTSCNSSSNSSSSNDQFLLSFNSAQLIPVLEVLRE